VTSEHPDDARSSADRPGEPERGRQDAERLREEARASIAAYQAFLSSPAFQHQVDLAILVKVAGNEQAPMRERLRAAEILARLRLEAMAAVAELTGTREQSLERLGIKAGPQSLALTQVNQKIEIVRARDWRSATPLAAGGTLGAAAFDGESDLAEGDAEDPALPASTGPDEE
jgi:hypothetical protein